MENIKTSHEPNGSLSPIDTAMTQALADMGAEFEIINMEL
tara:strand:+ start:136 stop:255 length:120 start_codon:yes stop_codon:yes gene_type:complete